jgi:hypothetical protein
VSGKVRMSDIDRWWTSVEKTDTCWLWTGYLADQGYGRFSPSGGAKYTTAHRWGYEALVGPVPDGLVVDHLCRVRHCVNPAHLEPVTQRENILRGEGLSAANAAKTHCKRGHEFTPENTALIRGGWGIERRCRTCGALNKRRYRAKQREQVDAS